MKFSGDAVIVTGGAQGIGRAVCQAFAREGGQVVIADIDEEAGREAEAALRAEGLVAWFIRTDVASEADVIQLRAATMDRCGRIDVVVNNAGIGSSGTLFSRPTEDYDRVLAVNLRGPYLLAKHCGQDLLQSPHGAIVNIASTRALMSEAHTEPYSASKGGLLALTHSLAVSLGPKVRVNAISPGWIEVTDWQKSALRDEPVHRPQDLAQHPAGRVGHPTDIARACLFLAAPDNDFITGANLVIDGGMTIRMIYEA